MSDERAPVEPQPVDTPWPAVPTNVDVGTADTDLTLAEWDRTMPDHAGLLDATPEG